MIKKLIVTTLAIVALATVGYSQTNSFYSGNEFALKINSGYVIDTSRAFQSEYSANIGVGADYFATKYLGVTANLPLYQTKGISVSEASAGFVLRVPLKTPIVQLSPYAGILGAYSWNGNVDSYNTRIRRRVVTTQYDEKEWTYIVKVGVEGRINKNWGTYVEGQFRNADFNVNNSALQINAGINLAF